jgi:hypothetical protein
MLPRTPQKRTDMSACATLGPCVTAALHEYSGDSQKSATSPVCRATREILSEVLL